jgi:choline dehydrogenase
VAAARRNHLTATAPLQKPNLGGRRICSPRGKVLGGFGSSNAMIFNRGRAADFDDWRNTGNLGWGFGDVVPYFGKLETHAEGRSEWHGADGRIHITKMRDATHPVSDAFLADCRVPNDTEAHRYISASPGIHRVANA